ncbi:MAG: FecR domain-containing protein [Bacteroidetes bacterium]|nr:FecR domain-containing protein [Bacteroidota bacterium]
MYPSDKDRQYFFELLSKYNNGSASKAETAFVERLLDVMEHRRGDAMADFDVQKAHIEKEIESGLMSSIQEDTTFPASAPVHRIHFLRRRGWWAAAAVIILVLTAGTYYLLREPKINPPATAVAVVNDVPPGKDGALLTLADGTQVSLDSVANGVIALQGNTEVKLDNGRLVYGKRGKTGNAPVAYNTMSTPRGRQFQLLLPDGSKVWLNAASSIKYPTAFTGHERKVEISGEAYFEVATDARKPFKVKINDRTEVEVLGTHFNINSYGDERSINTTLLEGSISVNHDKQKQLLKPGQQAQVQQAAGNIGLVNADINSVMAWKNGSFSFSRADLPAVMRQLARWYNIEIEYKGNIPSGTFSGEIDRSLTLDQVLRGLTTTRIHYTIEKDNRLLIYP